MRALLAKLKGPWLFARYIDEFAKNHVRKNEGQLYYIFDPNVTGGYVTRLGPQNRPSA